MVKYGIRIRNSNTDFDGLWMCKLWGPGDSKPIEFESRADAEEYAQNMELRNYQVEPLNVTSDN